VGEGDDEKFGGFFGGSRRDKVSLHYTQNPQKVSHGEYLTSSELGVFR